MARWGYSRQRDGAGEASVRVVCELCTRLCMGRKGIVCTYLCVHGDGMLEPTDESCVEDGLLWLEYAN
jgi:hypothetical protein